LITGRFPGANVCRGESPGTVSDVVIVLMPITGRCAWRARVCAEERVRVVWWFAAHACEVILAMERTWATKRVRPVGWVYGFGQGVVLQTHGAAYVI
jgi:hypothetical protein